MGITASFLVLFCAIVVVRSPRRKLIRDGTDSIGRWRIRYAAVNLRIYGSLCIFQCNNGPDDWPVRSLD